MKSLVVLAILLFAVSSIAQVKPNAQITDNGNDVVTGMAVDPKGGIYVTGYSKGPDTGYDFLTLKYNSIGKLEWSRRYDGGKNEDDKPTAIGIDSSGNVYVTGSSVDRESDSDYLTIKYDSSGALLWTKRFNGEGNGYDQPTAMVVDSAGNVVVTGFSSSKKAGYDCVTVKYDTRGKELWAKTYNGKANGDDFGNAVHLDGNGNIFVAGYSRYSKKASGYFVVKYSGDGHEDWSRTYGNKMPQDARATGLAVTQDGAICVTGHALGDHGSSDIFTVAFDQKGKEIWTSRYDGAGHGEDKASGIVSSHENDLIVIGASQGAGDNSKDFVTMKLARSSGKLVWENHYNGTASGNDIPTAVSVDSDGSIIVTGYSAGVGSGSDIVTVKYDGKGKEIWAQRYDGPANDVDRPIGVGTDDNGDVYVAGSSWGGKDNGFDFVTIKYSKDGHQVWTHRFDGSRGGSSKDRSSVSKLAPSLSDFQP